MAQFKIGHFSTISINDSIFHLFGNKKAGADSVYELRTDSEEDSKYIIKIHTKEENLDRFEKEIDFLKSNIDSKYIPTLISEGKINYFDASDTSLNGEYRYFVMRKYPLNFRKYLGTETNNAKKLDLFLSVCKCVSFLHKNNIIHRDIKPENILVDNSGTNCKAIICDFGISKFDDFNVTKRGDRIANANYCAPEQRKKDCTYDTFTDIYPLGLILNELFTGKLINGQGFVRIVDVAPSYGELDKIVTSMTQNDYHKRESDINNVINKIEDFIQKKNDTEKDIINFALNGDKSLHNRKIAKIFAEDCMSVEYAFSRKEMFGSVNLNYHRNIHCAIANATITKELELYTILSVVKHKFDYESGSREIEEVLNSIRWGKITSEQKSKFLNLMRKYEELKMDEYGEAIHYFSALRDYHSTEVFDEINRKFKSLEDDLRDSPICYLANRLLELNPKITIFPYNLKFVFTPLFDKSDVDLIDTNFFIDSESDLLKTKKLLTDYFPEATISMGEEKYIIFPSKKEYLKFIGKCKDYQNSLQENDIVGVDIEDMLSNIYIKKRKKMINFSNYEALHLLPRIFADK